MTTEEAKEYLDDLCIRVAMLTDSYGDILDTRPYCEAVDVAIQSIITLEEVQKTLVQCIESNSANQSEYYKGYIDSLIDTHAMIHRKMHGGKNNGD